MVSIISYIIKNECIDLLNKCMLHRHQQQTNTPSRGRRGNQPNVWYNRTAYSQVIE